MNEESFGYLIAQNTDLIRSRVLALAAALMMLNFIWALGRTFLLSGHLQTDYTPLIRALLLTIVLSLYPELIALVSGMVGFITQLFVPREPEAVLTALKTMTARVDAVFSQANDTLWKGFELSLDTEQLQKDMEIVLGVVGNSVEMFILKMVRFVAEGLTLLIRAFVGKMQVLVVIFLTITGPLALLIAMIPGYQGALSYWFRNLLHAKFWALTIGVLDRIVTFYVDNLVEVHLGHIQQNAPLEERFGAVFNLVVVHYCIIGAYLSTPLLTQAFIGGMASASSLAGWAAGQGAGLPSATARTGRSLAADQARCRPAAERRTTAQPTRSS